jgi:hypothetical protein
MPGDPHDAVVAHVAATRFPFPNQTTWPSDYVTITNVPVRRHGIPTPAGEHFPDILIVDGHGRPREIGEVETTLSVASVAYLRAGSEASDNHTTTGVRHFFLYVPEGLEGAAQTLLETHGISYAGIRGFRVGADGAITIVPFITPGDEYDHQ